MRLKEWIEKQGIIDAIYTLVERTYRKGYNDGLLRANSIFNDDQTDKLATDLIGRVFDKEVNDD